MITILLFGGIIGLVAAMLGAILALRVQYRMLEQTHIEREAWENAQEAHQLHWEKQQRKRTTDIEQELAGQVAQIQDEWQAWEARDKDRTNHLRQEYELLRLPTIEETPLPLYGYQENYAAPDQWQPPTFYRADLRGHDFSHRYLSHTDLREAKLAGANFFMADLRNACLEGADLSEANLTGANLAGADLRGASLRGAILLVADLHKTLLNGADLLGVHGLTTHQIYGAVYDHSTLLDPEIDITMPRLPSISQALPLTPLNGLVHAHSSTEGSSDHPLSPPQAASDSQHDSFLALKQNGKRQTKVS